MVDQHLLDETHDARGVELVDEHHDLERLDGAGATKSELQLSILGIEITGLSCDIGHSSLELLRSEALVHQQSMEEVLESR